MTENQPFNRNLHFVASSIWNFEVSSAIWRRGTSTTSRLPVFVPSEQWCTGLPEQQKSTVFFLICFFFFKACVYEHDWVLPFFFDSTLTHLDFVFKDRDVDWFPVRNSLAYLSQHRWWWWWQITQKYWCTVSIYIYSIHIQCNTYIWSNYSDVTGPHPKWWFSKGKSLFQGNLGWWNIIIWPDI